MPASNCFWTKEVGDKNKMDLFSLPFFYQRGKGGAKRYRLNMVYIHVDKDCCPARDPGEHLLDEILPKNISFDISPFPFFCAIIRSNDISSLVPMLLSFEADFGHTKRTGGEDLSALCQDCQPVSG